MDFSFRHVFFRTDFLPDYTKIIRWQMVDACPKKRYDENNLRLARRSRFHA